MRDPAKTLATILPALGRNLSVLILDDERFDRHRLARLCSGLPAKCDIANAASLGVFNTQLDATCYDLILVDYMLPDGTGLQALDAVRCSSLNFASPAIMVTSHADTTVARQALRTGCVEFLLKDALSTRTFQAAVAKALGPATLPPSPDTKTFERDEVEAVLARFTEQFASDIKPAVSRTLRQLRDLRSTSGKDRITAVEQSCMEIWETLVALERRSGADMMSDTLLTPPPMAQMARRKPPSPFTRLN